MTIFLFIVGLVLLLGGAEFLVRGASRMARSFGIPSLVIGLTVVAFGTSAPELAVSVKSALAGQSGMALGNVVGSNIFNVLLILGLAALVLPLTVSRQLVRLDIPLLIVLSALVWWLAADGVIGRIDGALLAIGLMVYTTFLLQQGRKQGLSEAEEAVDDARPMWQNVAFMVAGLAALVQGSRWLVDAAIVFAQALGVSEVIIGLTIVAAGTSLPEVVTSIVASVRGERDIAVGNVVGSNLFNLMGVLGISAVVSPEGIMASEAVRAFELPFMVAVAFVCLPIFFTDGSISRWEGGFLFAAYLAYVSWLILGATRNPAVETFSDVVVLFVVPLTVVTLGVVSWQAWKRQRTV
jgi:cation:H+ antiporter